MVIPHDTILLIGAGAAIAAGVAEWLHARRCARVERLAFGAAGSRAWIKLAGLARSLAVGALAWALLVLLTLDGAGSANAGTKPPTHHLVIALDVSPSMYIQDCAGQTKQSRQHRAADVVLSVLDRLDMSATRVSVVAFYSAARPVIIDTLDLAIIQNVLRDLPLSHAFKAGQTDMYAGVAAAAEIGRTWKNSSATLLVVSDGDTLPARTPSTLPPSFGDTIVVGVGDPTRASPIADRMSRQDSASLKRLAVQLHGSYHDASARHLPTTTLRSLRMLGLREDHPTPMRTVALALAGLGALTLAGTTPLLALLAARRSAPARAGAKRTDRIRISPPAREGVTA